MQLCQRNLLTISSNPAASELNYVDCKKGQVIQQPPIPYGTSNDGLLLSTTRDTIKPKTPEGEFKQALLSDRVQGEEDIKHLAHYLEKTGVEGDLDTATKAVLSMTLSLRKLLNVPKKEKEDAKAKRVIAVKAVKERLVVAKVLESTCACTGYDLFHKFLVDDPEVLSRW